MALVMYSKESCVQCKATARHLDKKGVAFEERSAVEHIEMLKEMGMMQAPVVVHYNENGEIVDSWAGFRPDKLNAYANQQASIMETV